MRSCQDTPSQTKLAQIRVLFAKHQVLGSSIAGNVRKGAQLHLESKRKHDAHAPRLGANFGLEGVGWGAG